MTKEYYTTAELVIQGILPMDIAEKVLIKCPECGYNIWRNRELTKALCSNPTCPGHGAHKADAMIKYFTNLKGYGPKTALSWLQQNKSSTYLDYFGFITQNLKPRAYLWEVVKFCYIPGISNSAEEMCAGYKDIDDYLNNCYNVSYLIKDYAYLIRYAQRFFELRIPLSRNKLSVMITGSIKGFSNRETFVGFLNGIVGEQVRIVACGPKQSADYLITEEAQFIRDNPGSVTNRKIDNARRGGVPIVTPSEFVAVLNKYLTDIIEAQ